MLEWGEVYAFYDVPDYLPSEIELQGTQQKTWVHSSAFGRCSKNRSKMK